VLLVGVVTAISAAARGSSPGPPPLQFLVIPLGDMFVFAILVGTALYYRRRMEIHKRLMLGVCVGHALDRGVTAVAFNAGRYGCLAEVRNSAGGTAEVRWQKWLLLHGRGRVATK
jgi:hypothetical protein